MHGHLNVNLSRCTVTRTSIYHDARSPKRQMTKLIVAFRNFAKAPNTAGNKDKCPCASAHSATCTAPFVKKLLRA